MLIYDMFVLSSALKFCHIVSSENCLNGLISVPGFNFVIFVNITGLKKS